MHAVDSSGFILESGNRRFIDQNLPGTPGTIDGAEWNNAIQEELLAVVVYAGLTPATSSTADRAAGWHQIRDAIFSSQAITAAAIANATITSAKIASLDLAKVYGAIAISGLDGALAQSWAQGIASLRYEKEVVAGGAKNQATLYPAALVMGYYNALGSMTEYTAVSPSGLTFYVSGQNTGAIAHQTLPAPNGAWSDTGDGWVFARETLIPKTRTILSAQLALTIPAEAGYDAPSVVFESSDLVRDPTGAIIFPNAYRIRFDSQPGSDFWKVICYTSADIGTLRSSVNLHVIYSE